MNVAYVGQHGMTDFLAEVSCFSIFWNYVVIILENLITETNLIFIQYDISKKMAIYEQKMGENDKFFVTIEIKNASGGETEK